MRKKYVRLTSYAALWSPRFGGVSLLALVIVSLLHRFSLIRTHIFLVCSSIAGLLALIALFLAAKGLYDLWENGDRGGLKSLKGIVYSLVTLTPISAFLFMWCVMPPLNDISTDTDTPPHFIAEARPADALPVAADLSGQANLGATRC